jgi:hypothetical protein
MYLNVGAKDPCLNSANQIDFWLQCMIKSWKSSNPAPLHVKPIPIQVIGRVASLSQLLSTSDFLYQATTDMIILAFFFLLWPGEYTDNNKTPFCLKDIQLFIGPCSLNLQTLSTAESAQACFGSLTFTDQKNGVRGEVPQQVTALSARSRHLCDQFFTSGLTMHPLLHPFHGFSTHWPKLHHQFSLLPSETLSSISAPILGSFLPKSLLKVFGPQERWPPS